MKKIFTTVTVLVLALTLSGCNLLGQKTEKESGQTGVVPEKEGAVVPTPKGKGTESYTFKALKAAIELGIPLKCSYTINNTEYEGYVKGKQWRGKIKTADGKIGEVIMKDNCMYSWEESKNQGAKMCFEQDLWDTSKQEAAPDVEYRCLPTIVDDGKFVPPANINFMDIDQMGKEGAND